MCRDRTNQFLAAAQTVCRRRVALRLVVGSRLSVASFVVCAVARRRFGANQHASLQTKVSSAGVSQRVASERAVRRVDCDGDRKRRRRHHCPGSFCSCRQSRRRSRAGKQQLKLIEPRCFRLSFNRQNIFYEVVHASVACDESGSIYNDICRRIIVLAQVAALVLCRSNRSSTSAQRFASNAGPGLSTPPCLHTVCSSRCDHVVDSVPRLQRSRRAHRASSIGSVARAVVARTVVDAVPVPAGARWRRPKSRPSSTATKRKRATR